MLKQNMSVTDRSRKSLQRKYQFLWQDITGNYLSDNYVDQSDIRSTCQIQCNDICMSDNDVNLSDHYVDISDIYIYIYILYSVVVDFRNHLSDFYVDLADLYVEWEVFYVDLACFNALTAIW